MIASSPLVLTFQSTLPLRGATYLVGVGFECCFISIHTPLAGSDQVKADFGLIIGISIHTPLAGSDRIRK